MKVFLKHFNRYSYNSGLGNETENFSCFTFSYSFDETNDIIQSAILIILVFNVFHLSGCMQSPVTAKDIMSTIIGAANRKMQKTSKHLISNRKAHTTHLNLPSGSTSDDSLNSVQNHQVLVSFKCLYLVL